MRTGGSKQGEAMRNFKNVIDLIQLIEEEAEQLRLSMSGEAKRDEQVGIKFRYDQRTRLEKNLIPS